MCIQTYTFLSTFLILYQFGRLEERLYKESKENLNDSVGQVYVKF